MRGRCRCGKWGDHVLTDDCLTPEDAAYVRAVQDALDELEHPWWHQAAGRT